MSAEETALRTTYGVWAWLLALPEDYLTSAQTKHVVDLTRDLYRKVLRLERPAVVRREWRENRAG